MSTRIKISILISFLLSFCHGLNAQNKKVERFNFPPEFGKEETIVLISGLPGEKTTKAMVTAFEKHYTGKFATMSSLSIEEMRDTRKYRYIFTVLEIPSMSGRDMVTWYKFGMKDQKTGKDYDSDFTNSSHKAGAKSYVENLEKFRKQNSGL